MQKKVFSLMMGLILAFTGLVKADVVSIGNGTSTTYYTPFNSLYYYSFAEQIYTADEIGTAGTINSISFQMDPSETAQTNSIEVFMKNVSRSTFSSSTDYETVTASDMVFSGTVTFVPGWTTITLDTPFQYDGMSNLMIGMHELTSGYSTRHFYYTEVSNSMLCYYSDSYNPNPYSLGSYSGNKYAGYYRSNIQIDITSSGPQACPLVVTPDPIDFGYRPNNCRMRPMVVTVTNEGAACLLYTSPSPRDKRQSRMPSSA